MADAWKKLNEKVRAKRTSKDPPKDHRRSPKGEELTVQRLFTEVSGKAQKYTRIGPREFVPFDESEEMTIGNIKSACERYFKTNLVCDILAGEQGPSCKTKSRLRALHSSRLGSRRRCRHDRYHDKEENLSERRPVLDV